jgi:hypothetical protein
MTSGLLYDTSDAGRSIFHLYGARSLVEREDV